MKTRARYLQLAAVTLFLLTATRVVAQIGGCCSTFTSLLKLGLASKNGFNYTFTAALTPTPSSGYPWIEDNIWTIDGFTVQANVGIGPINGAYEKSLTYKLSPGTHTVCVRLMGVCPPHIFCGATLCTTIEVVCP